MTAVETATILTNSVVIKPDEINNFVNWQAKLNDAIAKQPGFISLEILSPAEPEQPEWLLVQRFSTPEAVSEWQEAQRRKELMEELSAYAKDKDTIKETF